MVAPLQGAWLATGDAPIIVREFKEEIATAWDSFVLTQPTGTLFHQTPWMRALQRSFGYQAVYLYAEREGQITGVLPLFRISNWIVGDCLISTPFAVYGGVCAADDESAESLVRYAADKAVSANVDFLELRHRTAATRPGFHTKDLYFAFEAELSAGAEEILKGLPRDTRYMIRKGEKAGLELRFGLDQLSAFYELFCISMRRLGTPVFPRNWLQKLIQELPGQVDLALVYHRGRAVSGVFSLVYRDVLLPYYAGASPEANRVAANNFMYWALMKNAIDRGLRYFDFGRSKKGTGAYEFKSAWKMQAVPLNYQVLLVKRKEVPNFSPVNPKFEMVTRLWQRMPLPLTTWLGPRVVRWFP